MLETQASHSLGTGLECGMSVHIRWPEQFTWPHRLQQSRRYALCKQGGEDTGECYKFLPRAWASL